MSGTLTGDLEEEGGLVERKKVTSITMESTVYIVYRLLESEPLEEFGLTLHVPLIREGEFSTELFQRCQ
jgi:hypothetical protein